MNGIYRSDSDHDDVDNEKKRGVIDNYTSVPYGFLSLGTYTHTSKHCEIQAVTFNAKSNECVILDSSGVTSWVKNIMVDSTKRLLDFDAHKFNIIRNAIFCRTYNIYFALSKEYELRVFNSQFIEIHSHESDGSFVSCLFYNVNRKELISVGRNKLRFWSYSMFSNGKVLQGLTLSREYPIPLSSLVSNAVFDEELQRIYLLSGYDVICYDVDGQFVFHLKISSQMYLSVCVYSKEANLLVTGSLNGQINVHQLSGGHLTTFLNHTNIVTALLIHPSDGNMFISSSIDGTIKLFSLQLLEQLYSINVFPDGIYWMKLCVNNILYCASKNSVQLLDLNYTCKFWSIVRSPVKSLSVSSKEYKKSSHVVACAVDNSIRLYNRRTGQKKCTILPPPELSASGQIFAIAYDRIGRVIYLLFSRTALWIYSLRTDPATRVAVWNIISIISTASTAVGARLGDEEVKFGKSSFSIKQDDENISCNCLSTKSKGVVLESELNVHNFSYLLCGLSNGAIYFLDPSVEGLVYTHFKAHSTSPVIKIEMLNSRNVSHMSTLIDTKDGLLIRIWDLSSLTLLHEFAMRKNYTAYVCKSSLFVVGYENGMLDIKTYNNIPEAQDTELITKDHVDRILSVDILGKINIVCSCGKDQYVRIWNIEKQLLSEIKFDQSLCYSIFLDSLGTLLISFKSQLFVVPHGVMGYSISYFEDDSSSSCDDESFIYEDPYVKKEIKRSSNAEDITFENYLVPYPHLNLDSLWMIHKFLSSVEEAASSSGNELSEETSECSSIYADTDIYEDTLYSGKSRTNSVMFEFPQCDRSSSPSATSGKEEREEISKERNSPTENSSPVVLVDQGQSIQLSSDGFEDLDIQEGMHDFRIKSNNILMQKEKNEMLLITPRSPSEGRKEKLPSNSFGDTLSSKKVIRKRNKKKKKEAVTVKLMKPQKNVTERKEIEKLPSDQIPLIDIKKIAIDTLSSSKSETLSTLKVGIDKQQESEDNEKLVLKAGNESGEEKVYMQNNSTTQQIIAVSIPAGEKVEDTYQLKSSVSKNWEIALTDVRIPTPVISVSCSYKNVMSSLIRNETAQSPNNYLDDTIGQSNSENLNQPVSKVNIFNHTNKELVKDQNVLARTATSINNKQFRIPHKFGQKEKSTPLKSRPRTYKEVIKRSNFTYQANYSSHRQLSKKMNKVNEKTLNTTNDPLNNNLRNNHSNTQDPSNSSIKKVIQMNTSITSKEETVQCRLDVNAIFNKSINENDNVEESVHKNLKCNRFVCGSRSVTQQGLGENSAVLDHSDGCLIDNELKKHFDYEPVAHVTFPTPYSNSRMQHDKSGNELYQKLRETQQLRKKSRQRQNDARLKRSHSSLDKTNCQTSRSMLNVSRHSADPVKAKERLSIEMLPLFINTNHSPQKLDMYPPSPINGSPQLERKGNEKVVKIRSLENKLSGQLHRFHFLKTEQDMENDRVALMFLKAKEKGISLLPVGKSSVSIPNRYEYKLVEQVETLLHPTKMHFLKP